MNEVSRKHSIIINGLIAVCCIVAQACSSTRAIGHNSNVDIKKMPVAELQQVLSGTWKLVYKQGGFAGKTVMASPGETIQFIQPDSVYWSNNAGVIVSKKYNYSFGKTIFGYESNLVSVPNSIKWVTDEIRNDTLILRDNVYDGFNFFLVRK